MAETVETFLRSVLRSGLLDKEQLVSALRGVPKQDVRTASEVANYLIEKGKLSRFQAQKLLQGATLGLRLGPYHILAPLGKGGMGAVYLALDTRTGHHVAVKVLPPKRAREEERYLARFQREMELSRKVVHPHIALTHESGEFQGVHFLAMEYIPGKSLFQLVSASGPLETPHAAGLFVEVAGALAHAHKLGLIHRDLKPSNIMVTPNDHAKVLDFGLALMEGEMVDDIEVVGGKGYVVGSVDYMAPEQTYDPTQVDGRSDLYAMGCCLYFALCGQPPFPGGKTRDKVNAHRHQQPEPLLNRNGRMPPGFAVLIHRLMAKQPEERFADAAAAQAELAKWRPQFTSRPVEQEGDAAQRAAIAVAMAQAPAEELKDNGVILAQLVPELPMAEPVLHAELLPGRENRDMFWLLGVFGAFWAVVVLVLLAVLLFR